MTVTINGTTGVSGVAGSASTPALIGSDADSGYYINSANEPNASVNGTAVWNAASNFGFKNRLINGNMAIDQRNAGASISANGGYPVDRWLIVGSQASKFTAQQSSDAPAGFTKSTVLTSSSSYAVAGNDYFAMYQQIEANNVSDLGFGTANAKTVTLSFWAKSSLTGSFGGSLQNSAEDRCYSYAYTINAANTWEYKTVTVVGDTTGTWLTGTSCGIIVWFGLGATGARVGTAGAWGSQSGAGLQPTGTVSLVGTSGATLYITGVQLEKGSTATSFDFRSYGTELALCQRYYEKSYNIDVVPGTASSTPGCYEAGTSSFSNGVVYTPQIGFRVSKRATPTMTFYTYSGTVNSWDYSRSGATAAIAVVGDLIGSSGFSARVDVGASWVVAYVTGHWVASSEL